MNLSGYIRKPSHSMQWPDHILAYPLLEKACLSPRERQMTLTACQELKYDNVKSAMTRIFGEGQVSHAHPDVKEEQAYFSSYKERQKSCNRPPELRKQYSRPPLKQGKSPIGRDGKVTRCSNCGSFNHWFWDCPHRIVGGPNSLGESANIAVSRTEEACAVVLFNQSMKEKTVEPCGILDTACTSTVCGETCLNNFEKSISMSARVDLQRIDVKTQFVFGDGVSKHSKYRVKMPVEICRFRCHMIVDVIEGDLSLLFGKSAMKKMKAVIDTVNDEVYVFGNKVAQKLTITSSGHYALQLNFTDNAQDAPAQVFKTECPTVTR